MTPEDLAERHPRLYHLTAPEAVPGIRQRGLLTAASLVRLFELDEARCLSLTTSRRPTEVALRHPLHGAVTLSDNRPLSVGKLANCLDDGLTPADWIAMLNDRVFFWADRERVLGLRNAAMNRDRPRDVLAFDTLRLARAYSGLMEISPINSGATLHQPARRGRTTFTPLLAMEYGEWRRQRGRLDRVAEVVVRGDVLDIADFCVESVA